MSGPALVPAPLVCFMILSISSGVSVANETGGTPGQTPAGFTSANVVLQVPRTSSWIWLDGHDDEPAWAHAVEVSLTDFWNSGYYGGWGDLNTRDVDATARLLWDHGVLYVFIRSIHSVPMLFDPPTGNPWDANQILVGVDLTHGGGDQIDNSWSGWPWNASNLGPVAYKINPHFGGITLQWGQPFPGYPEGRDPVELGFVDGLAVVHDAHSWSVEMAIYGWGGEIHEGQRIGFNIGGAAADENMCPPIGEIPECTYAWYSWQASSWQAAGGEIVRDATTFASLEFVGSPTQTHRVSFAVDMSVQVGTGAFDPETDRVFVAGAPWYWDPTANELLRDPLAGDWVYTGAFEADFHVPSLNPYKFTILFDGWDVVSWEGGADRTFVVTSEDGYDISVPVRYFDDTGPDDILLTEATVTFVVDLRTAYYFLEDHGFLPGFGGPTTGSIDGLFINGPVAAASNEDAMVDWVAWDVSGLGQAESRRLHDDGVAPDATAGDRRYTRVYTYPAGTPTLRTGKFGVNGVDNEAGFGWDHHFRLTEGASTIDVTFGCILQPDGTYAVSYGPDGYSYSAYLVIDNFAPVPTCTVVDRDPSTGPVAVAGPDQLVLAGQTVHIDGSASTHGDGQDLSFAWSLITPTGQITDIGHDATVTFCAAIPGIYTAVLTVSDPSGRFDSDSASITAVTPSEALDILAAEVAALGPPAGPLTSGQVTALLAQLETARQSAHASRPQATQAALSGFQRQVLQLAARGKLSEEQALNLTRLAGSIADVLTNPCSDSASADHAATLAGLLAEDDSLPREFGLAVFPNPLALSGQVRMALPEPAGVKVIVYDLLGREVLRLVEDRLDAGRHELRLESHSLPNGVYLVRMVADTGFQASKRVTVLR